MEERFLAFLFLFLFLSLVVPTCMLKLVLLCEVSKMSSLAIGIFNRLF